MHHPLTGIQADLSIGLLDIKLPQKKNIDKDGRTSRTTTIGSFFEKKEKTTKNEIEKYF